MSVAKKTSAGNSSSTSSQRQSQDSDTKPKPNGIMASSASVENPKMAKDREAARAAFALRRDKILCWMWFFIAVGVRFFRLGVPSAVVFDEFHFGTFVDNILSGATHFDIHPPLGKLTLAFFGWLVGYRPVEGFGYDEIGKDYGAVLYYPLREIAAIFGALTVPLMYTTARKIGMSWVGSVLVAGLFCFDNLNVIESRLILMDSQIVFYLVLSLYCALQLWSTPRNSFARFWWLTATGFTAGCSLSVKWTGLGTPGLIAIVSFFGLHFMDTPLTVIECAWAAFVGIGLYMLLFWVHFQTMTHTGPGVGFFPSEFRATLIGEENYDPNMKRKPFLELFVYINKYMFTANAGITTRHHWESTWYQWIVNWRGLLYFNKQIEEKWAAVYLHNNPIVCWVCAGFVALFILALLISIRYRNVKILSAARRGQLTYATRTCIFLFWGWLINLLPYILVDRSAFVYHYLPGLIYAQLLTGVVVDQFPMVIRIFLMIAILACTIGTFMYYVPWIYCYPITSEQHAARRWLPKWD